MVFYVPCSEKLRMKILIRNQQRHRRLTETKISRAARKILSLLEQPGAELSILLIGDRKMLRLNTVFRGIRKSTDVLSFPQIDSGDFAERAKLLTLNYILGDIVINIPRAASQARMSGRGFYDEVYRLLIHGILHLLGYDHEKSSYKANVMKRKEKEISNAFKKIH